MSSAPSTLIADDSRIVAALATLPAADRAAASSELTALDAALAGETDAGRRMQLRVETLARIVATFTSGRADTPVSALATIRAVVLGSPEAQYDAHRVREQALASGARYTPTPADLEAAAAEAAGRE